MRRVLAILGALAMIGLAVVVRDAIDEDGRDGGGGGDGEVVLVCAADLADFCDTLEGVEIETAEAAATAAAMASGDIDGIDGWVTTSAWAEVVASRAAGVVDRVDAIARTPVAVAADPVRASAIAALCSDEPILGCLGEHAGQAWSALGGSAGWGELKTGLPDADSALGLAVLPALAAGFFGHLDFAANDFAGSFTPWLDGITGPSGIGDRDPAATLVTRLGTYSAAVSTEARTDSLLSTSERIAVQPAIEVTVVVARVRGADDDVDVRPLRDALVDAGWSPAADEAGPILKPGVLAALHTLWTEVTS